MANSNAPSGLAPVRYLSGAKWSGAANLYCILAADTNYYYVGDRVTTIGNAGSDANGIPAVTLAAAGTAARGVIVAVGTDPYTLANPNNLGAVQRLNSVTVNYYCLVVDDPMVVFEVQEGGVGTVLTTTSVNRNVNMNNGTRSTAGLILSPAYLDNNTVNTTSTLDLKIIQGVWRPDNTFGSANQKWEVILNNHEFRAGTTSP